MALHSVSDDSDLLEAWDTWSRLSGKYAPRECARQWRSFNRDKGTTVATLLKWAADDAGGMASPPRPPAAPCNTREPRSTAKTEVLKAPIPNTGGGPGGGIVAGPTGSPQKEVGDPGKICFAGSWTYPGDAHVLRFDLGAIDEATGKMKKVFRPIHKNGVNWFVGDPPKLWPLYHRDELPADGADLCLRRRKGNRRGPECRPGRHHLRARLQRGGQDRLAAPGRPGSHHLAGQRQRRQEIR